MKFLLCLVLLLSPIIASPHSSRATEKPDDKDVEEIVRKIQAGYDKITDLKSDFVQTVEIMDFNTPYVSKGKLYIKKGKMRWDYQEPSKQQIYVDGDGYLYYVPDHKQVIRSKVGGHSDSHLPLNLLSGREHLDKDFIISYEIENPVPGAPTLLRLVPKKKMGLIKIVITTAQAPKLEGLIINKVVLHEENGNISTSAFKEIAINQGLDDRLFVFDIPKDVEVLDAP